MLRGVLIGAAMPEPILRPEDLQLLLGPRTQHGVRGWLHETITAAIRDGRLQAGTRLPSSRAVATQLGVSRGPVVEAFDLLTAEGFLTTRDRSGSTVAVQTPNSGTADLQDLAKRPSPSPGTPDPELFPWASWSRAMRAGASRIGTAELEYGDPCGLPLLRVRVAELLRLSRGAVVDPDRVVITNGVAQGMAMIASVLRSRGQRRIAVEDPSSPGNRESLAGLGLQVIGVPVDERGIDTDNLPPRAGAVLVTPTHQYPLGALLAPDRRRRLLDWAGSRLVIEGDYDAELRYDGAPVPVLQAMDPDRVMLLGSLSKVLTPALRLGWMVAPSRWHGELVAAKRHTDLGTSLFDQAALAEFIGSGDYQRHVQHLRQVYRVRRSKVVSALSGSFHLAVGDAPAGLQVVVRLADADAEARAIEYLSRHDVVSHAFSRCFIGKQQYGIVLGTARAIDPPILDGLIGAVGRSRLDT